MTKSSFCPAYLPHGLPLASAFRTTVLPAQVDQFITNSNNNPDSGHSPVSGGVLAGIGNAVSSDGTIRSLNDLVGADICFYRTQIQ